MPKIENAPETPTINKRRMPKDKRNQDEIRVFAFRARRDFFQWAHELAEESGAGNFVSLVGMLLVEHGKKLGFRRPPPRTKRILVEELKKEKIAENSENNSE